LEKKKRRHSKKDHDAYKYSVTLKEPKRPGNEEELEEAKKQQITCSMMAFARKDPLLALQM